mmetsp:Transcript_14487/g.17618  ORF Transcript_14487/g.17618 Transcript_14487/m.17618 type:complete len:359 (-) Transcript_14487:168-1244(-)
MVSGSSPSVHYQPLSQVQISSSSAILLATLKRTHMFLWICLVLACFIVWDNTHYSRVSTLKEFWTINQRLTNPPHIVVQDCECGCVGSPVGSCPRQYDLQDVDKSARVVLTDEIRESMDSMLQEKQRVAQQNCLNESISPDQRIALDMNCFSSFVDLENNGPVTIPNPYRVVLIPKGHYNVPRIMFTSLQFFIEKEGISSLSDFGAGVGQYGAYFEKNLPPSFVYNGYDSAGDVEVYTQNYIKYADLIVPLNLPVTDYVLSLEVGEHISNNQEGMMIRNLHAHNCKGIILSWAIEGQDGNGHINLHNNDYLIKIFEQLGYVYDVEDTENIRNAVPSDHGIGWWFKSSIMIFKRIHPVC